MSVHGCITCSECGGACPLCGTCACQDDNSGIFEAITIKTEKDLTEEIISQLKELPREERFSVISSLGNEFCFECGEKFVSDLWHKCPNER